MDSELVSESASGDAGSERAHLTDRSSQRSERVSFLSVASLVSSLTLIGYVSYLSFRDGVVLFSFHPPLMATGWLLIISAGVNAFSPTELFPQLMPVQNRTTRHWILQTTGAVLVLAGFAVIFANKMINNKSHFTSIHGVSGLVSVVLMLLTMCGGLLALYGMKFKNLIAPVYLKLAHGFVGLFTYSFALVTMMFPLYSAWWNDNSINTVLYVLMLFFVMGTTVVRPIIKLYVRVRERLSY